VISLGAVMRIESPPPSMSTLRDDVSDAIDVVVRRALEPDRDKRWPDLDSFLDALQEAHKTGKIPAGLVPAEDLPVPVAPAGVDQETALSAANAPTVTPADSTPAVDATTAPAALVATGTPRKRSTRAWLITVVLALILAAGGGYGGYRLVMSRPVTVEQDNMSVKVPRAWDQKSTQDKTKLLVTPDIEHWVTNSAVPGVYLEKLTGDLPKTGKVPTGCTLTGDAVPGNNMVTFYYQCQDAATKVTTTVGERYQKAIAGTVLRTQARDTDNQEVQRVLDSATLIP
jgi:hypothetical protein